MLLFVDLSGGMSRLGGSALAQCYGQLGSEVSDLDNPELLKSAFNVTQKLIQGLIKLHEPKLFRHFFFS